MSAPLPPPSPPPVTPARKPPSGWSLLGLLVGCYLLLGTPCCTGLVEQQLHKQDAAWGQSQREIKTIKASKIDKNNNNRLIHTTGAVAAKGGVADPDLGIKLDGVLLSRAVEMYQWEEDEECSGRRRRRTCWFEYEKTWSSVWINSDRFQEPGYDNPPLPIEGGHWSAASIKLGRFKLGEVFHDKLPGEEAVKPGEAHLKAVEDKLGGPVSVEGKTRIFVGRNPERPQVGDLRITYTRVPAQTVSLVGQQRGDTLTAFKADNGVEIAQLAAGERSSAQMIQSQESADAAARWCGRFITLLFMLAGGLLTFPLLEKVLGRLPGLKVLVAGGRWIAGPVVALSGFLMVIALAGLGHQPLVSALSCLGATLLLLGGSAVGAMIGRRRR